MSLTRVVHKPMTMDDVPARCYQLMAAEEISRYRLAKRSGIPISTLYNMLDGKSVPSIEIIQRICDAFHITLQQFFSPEVAYEHEFTGIQIEVANKTDQLTAEQAIRLLGFMDGMLADIDDNSKTVTIRKRTKKVK